MQTGIHEAGNEMGCSSLSHVWGVLIKEKNRWIAVLDVLTFCHPLATDFFGGWDVS
jgi:hypothetical protein